MDKELTNHIGYLPHDGTFYWKKKARGRKVTGKVGFKDSNGYLYIQDIGRKFRAHKLAWFLHYGNWPDLDIDHINQDKGDNRIENLRLVTPSENGCNRPTPKSNISGVKGVYFSISRFFDGRRPWVAQVVKNRRKRTKYFDTIFDAAEEVRTLRDEIHGIYASH